MAVKGVENRCHSHGTGISDWGISDGMPWARNYLLSQRTPASRGKKREDNFLSFP